MSVMIISENVLKRIGKYLNLRTYETSKTTENLQAWHELNIKNYCEAYKSHGEVYEGALYDTESFDYSLIPIPSAIQVMSDLSGLHYNCVDYGEDINEKAFKSLTNEINKILEYDDYKATVRFEDDVCFD